MLADLLIDSNLFFFFKQETAYEMRISYWSSDVCSSDLGADEGALREEPDPHPARSARHPLPLRRRGASRKRLPKELVLHGWMTRRKPWNASNTAPVSADGRTSTGTAPRSEEHTSELQSLMRISYAVFCLKKKTQKTQ